MSEKNLNSNDILEAAKRAKVKFNDVEEIASVLDKSKEKDGEEKDEVRE